MMQKKDVLLRYSQPGIYDHAPLHALCKVSNSDMNNNYQIYIQLSPKDDEPNWTLIGEFTNQDTQEYIDTEINKILNH